MDNQFKNSFTRHSSVSSMASGRKSMLSKKGSVSGRYSLSGRSNQSTQIIARSEYNVAENYGNPLPVLVNEALTFSERSASVSISCSSNGWAWAVCGRRLLVWQYKESRDHLDMSRGNAAQRRIVSNQCRELSLPHCDIGHKATLITVFQPKGQQMASCLAISPTGDIRYWPSIAHDGSSVDENGILEGQEFHEMIYVPPIGYILVTTTCTLVLFQVQLLAGRHTVVHRQIKAPSGFLGGIGRKFASIIIGMNSQEKENRLLKICAEKINESEWIISLLADRWIQKWSFNVDGEQLLSQDCEIVQKIRAAFHQKFWSNMDNTEVEVSLIDMQPDNKYLVILAAASLPNQVQQYALITLKTTENSQQISNFCHFKYNPYGGDHKKEMLDQKFILNNNMAYVYNTKFVQPVPISDSDVIEEEKLEFQSPGDKLMAAAVFNNLPLFFSRLYGLVSVSPCDFGPDDLFKSTLNSTLVNTSLNQSILSPNNTAAVDNLTLYELDPDEVLRLESDDIGMMKAAFLYHLKGNSKLCMDLLKQIAAKAQIASSGDSDNLLDALVVQIAQALADDVPAADPRWEQDEFNQKHALGSSVSMQIVQQLREKNTALMQFIEFLHATKMWEKFDHITYRGTVKSTCHVLADLSEKIVAAIALKLAHNNYPKQIDEAINAVLIKRKEVPTGSLTNQDLFYVKTSKIHEIFSGLLSAGNEYIQREFPTAQVSSILVEINTITLGILNEVVKFRDSKVSTFALPESKRSHYEYLPWTASISPHGIRDVLLQFIETTIQHGIRASGEPELLSKHYQQVSDLIDFSLDARRRYLDSIEDKSKYAVIKKQYESQRSELIFPLIQDEQYQLACQLAEKYCDFQSLMLICDKTDSQSRLESYVKRFEKMDFSQFAINWHLRHSKQGVIFQRFKSNQQALSKFLCDHPSLAWVQLIFNGELDEASRVLFDLGKTETKLLKRRKSIMSIAKLAGYASGLDANDLSQINQELLLIEYQEQLPIDVLYEFGCDPNNMVVLSPEKIIDLYICPENRNADESHFRKALDLLDFIDEPFEMRQQIFCAAILRDKWTRYNTNAPLETVKELFFFKLIDLCARLDGNINGLVPPIDDLLSAPELESLVSEKVFHFLLKLGYEHISNVMNY